MPADRPRNRIKSIVVVDALPCLAAVYNPDFQSREISDDERIKAGAGMLGMSDEQTENLSGEIAKKIQDEMTYPGQVKITVIRETRAVSFAK